ncbi:MAG TPA: M50 family metallopeptidase [Gemmatimonadaceae bacterium]
MLAVLAPLIVFGLVVFVHELGHFLVAKFVGVYTPRFSIGFGPPLFKKRWGETEYILAAFPIGGYVRMASREDDATAFLEGGSEASATRVATKGEPLDPNAMVPFGPKPIPPERWFESKPLTARLAIMLAGVTMNTALALIVTTGVFTYYGTPYLSTRADSVLVGRPAALSGVRAGDSVIAINGTPMTAWDSLVERISASAGVPVTIDVVRGNATRRITVTPIAETLATQGGVPARVVGRIGIVPRQGSQPVSFPDAVVNGWKTTWVMAGSVIGALKGLATREVSPRELGGPIMIATASVQAARGGFQNLLFLLALISINLAVFNLLPIPILDGGQILVNVLEAAKGSAFSTRTKEYILRAGLFAVLLLFALVTYNDLRRLFVSIIQRFG